MGQSFVRYFPILGIILYVALFVISASFYPGGSRINPDYIGFDWIHNYWCDLMGKESYTGEKNAARPIAIIGWTSICLSLAIVFWQSINLYYPTGKLNWTFKTTALCAAGFGYFAFTDFHDLMVALSFPFGAVTVIALTVGLFKSDLSFFKYSVIICIILLSISFLMYFTSIGLFYLGVTQKISLAISLIWLSGYYYTIMKKPEPKITA